MSSVRKAPSFGRPVAERKTAKASVPAPQTRLTPPRCQPSRNDRIHTGPAAWKATRDTSIMNASTSQPARTVSTTAWVLTPA